MKNDKILNINNYCESCRHLMQEAGEDLSLFSTDKPLDDSLSYCYRCGQPILSDINPFEKDLDLLESALLNPRLKVVCYTAPSVRVALGDEFGMKPGAFVQGKMVSALKRLGFHAVFDMNTAADFTIIEEANEFVERLKSGRLPMFTSCCPGWVNYATKLLPQYIDNLSTTKSPQQIFGALLNTYYAQQAGIDPKDLFVVSIVPCVSKKLELKQSQNAGSGLDVDVAITTRELAQFLRHKGIDLPTLDEEPFDEFFGVSSGAGAIFGNTGGVMEAVLRTLESRLDQKTQARLDFKMVRGLDSVRRATVEMGGRKINLAVVTGLKSLPIILEELAAQPQKYDFIEVMACDGGCIGGAGQPQVEPQKREEVLRARSSGLYGGEKKLLARRAHENPMIKRVYDDFLGEVGGEKAQKLLHRTY